MKKKFIVLFLSIFNYLYPGFSENTFVKLDDSFTIIQSSLYKNNISSFDIEHNCIVNTECVHSFTLSNNYYYRISVPHDVIICSQGQKFYDPLQKAWIKPQKISKQSCFLDYYGQIVPCIQIDKIKQNEPVVFYEISLNSPHTYFVSKAQILTHNIIPIAIGLSWAIGEGITLTGAGIGLGALGLGLWQKFGKNKKLTFAQIERESITRSCSNAPDPDDKDKLKNRRKKAEELASKMGFKEVKDYKFNSHGEKVYRKGEIEITLDRDSHNGGFWKMFRRKTYNRLGTYNQNLSIKIGK